MMHKKFNCQSSFM